MTALAGKMVLITGASRGIGAATARALARKQAHVLLLARNQLAFQRVAHPIVTENGQPEVYPIDLTEVDAIDRLAAAACALDAVKELEGSSLRVERLTSRRRSADRV